MGTAIHTYIHEVFKKEDPFNERYLLEESMESEGIKGHIDLFDIANCEVVDWKTITKSKISRFPSEQQRWQVQLYGWLLANHGHQVKQVSLVAIPRDADMSDIRVHLENYDPAIAQEALEWLGAVKKLVEIKHLPPPGNYPAFCAKYCKFYDASGEVGCQGMRK
jgi:CRISPR/Cas system-associated exonuclease Cas4 (RecB family)